MTVYIVMAHYNNLDHDSGTVDEQLEIVKLFSRPERANDFLEGKPSTSNGPYSRWFTVEPYEVE